MIEIQAINYNGRPPTSELRGVFGPEGGTFGRGPDNKLTLPDPARHVSRIQASIRFDGSRYLISNVSAANPLFLNEEEIESGIERAIQPGDGLRVGLYQLVVREAPQAAPVAPAKPGAEMDTIAGPRGSVKPGVLPLGLDPLATFGGVASGLNPFADLLGGATPLAGSVPAAEKPLPSAQPHTPLPPRATSTPTPPRAASTPTPPPRAASTPTTPPRAPSAPPPPLSGDPFADLMQPVGHGTAQPTPPSAPLSSDPFADLLRPAAPAAGRANTSAAPGGAGAGGKATFAGGIPEDFDAFALPSKVPRNSDDPLRDLAGGAIGLNAVGAGEQKSSMLEFDLAKKADPKDLLQGGTPSLVDPLSAVDPLELFGGSDDGLLRGRQDPLGGSAPMRDNVPELGASFKTPRGIPAPPPAARPAASGPLPAAGGADAKGNPLSGIPPSMLQETIVSRDRVMPRKDLPPSAPGVPTAASPNAAKTSSAAAQRPATPTVPSVTPPASPTDVTYIAPQGTPVAKPLPPPAAAAQPWVTTQQLAPRPGAHQPATPPRNPTLQPPPAGSRAPAATGSSPRTAEADALLAAFLKGAGVPNMAVPNGLTPELMELMGTLVYKATAGAMELIAARQITKREIRAEVTMIVAQGNNPLKFLPTPEAAIMQMLGPKMPGFMRTADAMQDAFDDLRAHEVGVIAGMRAALGAVLKRFDPAVLEARLGKGGLLDALVPNAREGKLWNLFSERFQEIFHEAEDDFQALFGQAFIKAYEEQVAQDRAKRKRS
jgi:FHA domain-containing protein